MTNKAVEQWIEQFNTSFASTKTINLDSLFQEEFFWLRYLSNLVSAG